MFVTAVVGDGYGSPRVRGLRKGGGGGSKKEGKKERGGGGAKKTKILYFLFLGSPPPLPLLPSLSLRCATKLPKFFLALTFLPLSRPHTCVRVTVPWSIMRTHVSVCTHVRLQFMCTFLLQLMLISICRLVLV